MHCPFCGHTETKVIDSRLAGEGRQIRRRRECLECAERFTTFEAAELLLPTVVKGDRSREPFDESKLLAGMQKALEKRPVSARSDRSRGRADLPQVAQSGRARNRLARHRRTGHGGAAASGRGRLRAIRVGVPQLSGRRGVPNGDRPVAPPRAAAARPARISCRSCRAMSPATRANERQRSAQQDRAHMARALELAARGLYTTDPNPRVGCVLVRGGRHARRRLA